MTSPYYQFSGVTRRFPYNWNGGQGGVLAATRGPETRGGLGMADMLEAGYGDPTFQPYYQLTEARMGVGAAVMEVPIIGGMLDVIASAVKSLVPSGAGAQRRKANARARQAARAMGDYPLLRPDGPEPIDPQPVSGIPVWDGLSDNEKVVVGAAAAIGGYLLYKKMRKRRR